MTRGMPAVLVTFLRFGTVGVVNTVMSYVIFMLALAALPPVAGRAALAQVPAYGVGMVTSFLLNRLWTFAAARDGVEPVGGQVGRFVVTQVACLALTAMGLSLCIERLGLPVTPSWLAVSLCVILLNFAAQRLWVFPE